MSVNFGKHRRRTGDPDAGRHRAARPRHQAERRSRPTLHRAGHLAISRASRLALAGVLTASFTAAALSVTESGYADTTDHVSGTVFLDYNANGALDAGSTGTATDVGVANATITVTDSTGAVVKTGTSAADGTFDLTVTAATADVRVSVTPPAGYQPGPHGADAGSTTQFVALGSAAATHVGVALVRAGDYAQDAPRVVEVRQAGRIDANGNPIDSSAFPTVISDPYTASGAPANSTPEATAEQTGTVWGVAQYGTDYAITAAFLRRHADTGPGGLGALYVTHLGGAPDASVLATIPNAGTDPRGPQPHTSVDWFHDPDAYPAVGKTGLGGVTISPDRSNLYVVNLNDRKLYRVPLTAGAGGAPTAGTPVAIDLPLDLPGAAQGCATADVRPFGVNFQNGAVWVPLTCTGPAAGDLRGYVYRYVPGSGFDSAPAFELGLAYPRGFTYTGNNTPGTFVPWTDSWPLSDPGTSVTVQSSSPQPVLSDVVFDSNGDMTIAIKDRFGDQASYKAGSPNPASNTRYEVFAGGDILRACGNSTDGWTLENAGHCGSRTGVSTNNNQGPGGGEYYADDYGGSHQQTSLGALLQVPGFSNVANTQYDTNTDFRATGVRFEKNSNGNTDYAHQLVDKDANGGFGKAGGLGDLTALIQDAPLEIGNRVWLDSNHNGIQDAGETPIAGVTVDLYAANGTTKIGTAVTDADGNYYFSSATGTDTGNAKYGLPLDPNTDYVVKIDNPADFDTGGPLDGLLPTDTKAGSDATVDSNGATVGGVDQATVTTGDFGSYDHTIDFGFTPPTYAVGDYTWIDSDGDGRQGPGEPPLAGVQVVLLDANGDPAKHADGSPVDPVITDAQGHYVFDFLDAGQYRVAFKLPTGYTFTTPAAGSDQSVDSNPAVDTGVTPVFTVGAVGGALPNMRDVEPGDGTERAVAIDPTIDAGVVPVPSVSVGDYVWLDQDRDGIQDAGEKGIVGVQLTITGPNGDPVTDIFGHPVGPQTTDSNGKYLFADLPTLPAGQHYTVHVDNGQPALAPYLPTTAGAGSDHAVDSSTSSAASEADLSTDGASDLTLDFGFVSPRVSVGDYVWLDADGNGIQDAGEDGIAGVQLTITGPNGDPVTDVDGNPVGPQTTDGNGKYSFDNLPVLPAGQHYTVHLDNAQAALNGLVPTKAGAGADTAVDSSTGSATSGDLTSDGDRDPTLDFGFVKGVSVGDYVWVDTDRDGVQDPGEPGIEGVTLTITNADGGPVLNVDGTPAPTTTTTDADGHYEFTGLAPGKYVVTVTPPTGYLPTTPGVGDPAKDSSTGSATSDRLPAGANDPTLDFGFVRPRVSVGDYVWVDKDGDGRQDDGEKGIAGVTVTLTGPDGKPVTDVDGHPVAPVKTDKDGKYSFDDLPVLPAGEHYTVHVDNGQPALDGYFPTKPGVGDPAKDSSTGSATSGDLTTDGDRDPTLDFGFVQPVRVGDYVWVDKDHDGRQDKGEQGIPGVTVTITHPDGSPVVDVHGKPVGPVKTDKNGKYVFPDLPPGTYVTHVDASQPALAKYRPTRSHRGDRAGDSSTGSARSNTLQSGESDLTLDFGFWLPTNGTSGTGSGHGTDSGNGNGTGNTSDTGVRSAELIGVGGLLLLAGSVLLLAVRRRRRA